MDEEEGGMDSPQTPLIRRTAVLSEDGLYRYQLTREWGDGPLSAVFVMLNPSTADANVDDPTIRRCMDFARRWLCDRLEVVNLFAYRATKPADLWLAADPMGPLNYQYLVAAARPGPKHVICAWGNGGHTSDNRVSEAGRKFEAMLTGLGMEPTALRLNRASREPSHPLYISGTTPPRRLKDLRREW